MLLYLSKPTPTASDNVLCDSANNPAVPQISQTEIVESKSKAVIAQIDWDGPKPIYIDFGNGDERVMSDMLYPKSFLEHQLVFQTPGDLRWTLTRKSMELQSELASGALARFCPSSRVTSDGSLEFVSSSARNIRTAKDWLELNLIEFSPLSVAELLVDFVILESFRRVNFWIPDPEPTPSSATSSATAPTTKSRSRSSTGPTLPRLRLRQAVS